MLLTCSSWICTVELVSSCWNLYELRSFCCCRFWSSCFALFFVVVFVLEMALCSWVSVLFRVLNREDAVVLIPIYIVDFWVDYGSVGFFFSHLGGFQREKVFVSFSYCLCYIIYYLRSIFLTGSTRSGEHSYIPLCVFPNRVIS